MIALKEYQSRVLDSLRYFFHECSRDGQPTRAFQAAQERNGQGPSSYISVAAPGLSPRMPYVCVRVPTGGGKTLLACHAASLAMTDLLYSERAVVLWLVPSNTILDQTANALRDPRHPYRRALELGFGQVEVVTIEEALHLSRALVEGQTVIIVSTIQSFRVEDTTGRRVYGQNSSFLEHFQDMPHGRIGDLLPGAGGTPKPSLVNMLRLRRPIVIVDEAHNARTGLSFSTLGNVLPSCIVEFTATPASRGTPSNVLHRVSAAELKAADMVKLPLRVVMRHPSQRAQLLADAVSLRADLEKMAIAEAQLTEEYIRPILLIQAERVDACSPLRDQLVSELGISRDEVRISVGELDELRDVTDILLPSCPVRVVITVQKLREGWDCPFAYVLCSLRETRSPTAIEQIVGRVLRLPNARAKRQPELNCSYALSVSDSIGTVLAELSDALVSNGFTSTEAARVLVPYQGTLPLGIGPRSVRVEPGAIDPQVARVELEHLGGRVRLDDATGEITVLVPLSSEEMQRLTRCVTSPEARRAVEQLVEGIAAAELAFGGSGAAREPTAFERDIPFSVPQLCVREGDELIEFESTMLLEHPWRLSEKDASLAAEYNPLSRPAVRGGLVDVGDRGDVRTTVVSEERVADFVAILHQHTFALAGRADWSLEEFVAWLDRHIDHRDIPVGESAEFLRKVVRGLLAKLGIVDVGALALDRFRLRDEVDHLIQSHRESERKEAFQIWMLPSSALVVTPERAVDFRAMVYEPSWRYEGGFEFKKHYFGPKPGELKETTERGGQTEEFVCAQFIDSMSEVEWWVRNLPRKASSFRLQTSTDWFYPDFACRLLDGRSLVVEYKGEHLFAGVDAEEKRAVGAVWESRSGGRCLFVMPTHRQFRVIEDKVRS